MSSSGNKSKSSGLRILWIPGGRKSHPKGRYDSTNKHVTYGPRQKKSENWSLGGSRNQRDLLNADPDTALLDGPSVSGLTTVTCALGAASLAEKCTQPLEIIAVEDQPTTTTVPEAGTATTTAIATSPALGVAAPTTPDSTTSTAPLVSPPNSPLSPLSSTAITMPTKTTITTTATAEIIDENRFALLSKSITEEVDVYELPSPPKNDLNLRENLLLNTTSMPTPSSSATTTPSTSPRSNDSKSDKNTDSLPSKKKSQNRRNHNNNNHQSDINSIESISDDVKVPDGKFDWVEDLIQDSKAAHNMNQRKKKMKPASTKELDQLDGVPSKSANSSASSDDDDEKLVTCLHYTLMCCDCAIS